jgi:hypothetical protein
MVQAHVSLLVEKAEVTFVGNAEDGEAVHTFLIEGIESVGFGATHLQTKQLGAGIL